MDGAPRDDEERTRLALLHMLEDLRREREALREARRQWIETVDSVRDPLMVHDAEGRVVRANRAYVERAGMSFAELIGRPYWECFPKRSGPLPQCAALHLAAGRGLAGEEEVAADGRIFLSRAFGVGEAPPQAGYSLHLFEDVTERRRIEREIEQSEARFRALMEHASDLVAVIDREGTVRYASPSVRALGGYGPEEVLGRPFTSFMHPDDAPAAMQNLAVLGATPGSTHAAEFRYRCKDGRWIVLASMAKNALDDPAVQGIVLNARDITEAQRAGQELARRNRMLAVLSGINALIVRTHRLDELYAEACRIVVDAGGLPLAWIARREPQTPELRIVASAGDDRGYVMLPRPLAPEGTRTGLSAQAMRTGHAAVCNDIARDPQAMRFPAEALARGFRAAAALPLVVGGEARAVLVLFAAEAGFFDVGEMKLAAELAGDIAFAIDHIEKEKKVEYLAYYDPLTGLPRGPFFMQSIGGQLAQAAAEGRSSALVVGDLERFRNANDTLGRSAGDALLAEAARRLAGALGESVRLARMHADVFAFALVGVEGPDAAARAVRDAAARCFGQPLRVGATEVPLGMRFGMAMSPADGSDPEALYRNAESALKRAKEAGERLVMYSAEMNARVAERLMLEARMRKAVEEEQFELHYQPKFDSRSGALAGVEALLRWRDPQGALVPPASFVPLLEDTGLILPVGAWALGRAVRQAREWRAAGLPVPRIAVNVSALQLRQADFVDTVRAALDEDPGASSLDLEITESLIMKDVAANIAKLRALREAGVFTAIDDFGTGYSSLAYIAKLPIDTLKIDRSFVVAMPESSDDMGIVSTIIALAHQMSLKVVAEGVDSEEQAKLLRLLKCDQMQGYLFSKPVPAAEIPRLLKGAP